MNTALIEALEAVLADSYALYLKTQNYHWNVEGPHFVQLHTLFEEQYTDLAEAVDTIAELIRSLGAKAPGTFAAFSEKTSIVPGNADAGADAMVAELADDQQVISRSLQQALEAAQHAGDEVAIGLLVERMTVHRKNAWMLRSSVQPRR